jgi:2-hydroxycyclohexanecarboxyl-CoA dehydrogenase
MLSGLSGKLAIVAGAGSGIGRAVALKLVANDCRVGLFDLSEEGLVFFSIVKYV